MNNLQTTLKEKFKLEDFREWQEEIIKSVLDKKDTLVFMPTWGGKSLTYQIPWVLLSGVTIVISPLISLMKDQVDKLNALGIRAELINSTLSLREQNFILTELEQTSGDEENAIKFLYIAPERLNSRFFLQLIENVDIGLVAIDEAHCISQWGHDFRPSYMKIKWFLEKMKQRKTFPVIALTATATKKVRQDIVERLWFWKYQTFIKGFDRKNIIILVREISKHDEKLAKTLEIIQKTAGSGIIYCASRKAVDEVYDFLLQNNISVWKYTGAMSTAERELMQNNFMQGLSKVIVATNAFGMGIDKKDIRFVIHYNLPGSIENYYQEVGRAGRDGKNSYGVVLASFWDVKIQEFFIENIYPEKKEVLDLYDYLYQDVNIWEGRETEILKTYSQIAKESWIWNDMKVGTIVKLLEKYGILWRWVEGEGKEGFRGRGITLLQEKRKASTLLIDWKKQKLLEKESYFKLEQIKKLLFYPRCRKRFILEYFWDEEDLAHLWKNCGSCDYCLEKKKRKDMKTEKLVNLSVFEIILDAVKKINDTFGVQTIAKFLWGSQEKNIKERALDTKEEYGVLKNYALDFIVILIEALVEHDFLEKSSGMYPLLSITKKWEFALSREYILKDEEKELQLFIAMKSRSFQKTWKKTNIVKEKTPPWETYQKTLTLWQIGKNIWEIATEREMSSQTIEEHIIKLYEKGEITKESILEKVDKNHIAKTMEVIQSFFADNQEKLKPIKEKLEELWFPDISYFEIKLSLSFWAGE